MVNKEAFMLYLECVIGPAKERFSCLLFLKFFFLIDIMNKSKTVDNVPSPNFNTLQRPKQYRAEVQKVSLRIVCK